jgi:hypothetical protein
VTTVACHVCETVHSSLADAADCCDPLLDEDDDDPPAPPLVTDGGTRPERGQSSLAEHVETADTLDEDVVDDDACPNGAKWCPGPGGDVLPCWPCFAERDVEEVRES